MRQGRVEQSEAQFQGWVVATFQTYGWHVKHVPTPMRPTRGGRFVPDRRGAGLLDLLLIHTDPPRMLFAECKKDGGKVSDEQREMIGWLREVVEHVRERFAPDPCPIGVALFKPGAEPMIEAIARGKMPVPR